MTLQEMLTEIPRLTTQEQLLLLEAVSRSLREGLALMNPDQRALREATVDRLFGVLRPDGTSPTDAELKDAYTDYLSEKYS
jgi:hypothetical protein